MTTETFLELIALVLFGGWIGVIIGDWIEGKIEAHNKSKWGSR